jgi:regulator of protease activity HflC (stomatin/prohibitin superfamily)
MLVLTCIALVALFVLSKLMLIIPMAEVCVIERLGKFRVVLKPGFHLLIPFLDRVAYRHETREEPLDIPSQSCISQDNTQIDVDGLIYIQVMDGHKASYGIENYKRACINLAQTTMRSEIGKLSLGKTFSERDQLNEIIVKEIDKASQPWGIKVLRYEVKNITPSLGVINTLEKQMEAERNKRAKITLAEAEKEATINLSVGERQAKINISEGEKQQRINEAKGRGKEITILAEATAKGMELVGTALEEPGGDDAMRLRLLSSFIDQTGEVLGNAKITIMPAEMTNVTALFKGLDQISQPLTGASK